MRKKIFTFLLALAASVGMMNAKVTWNSSNISDLNVYATYESYSKEGVTLSANGDEIMANWQSYGDESMDGINFHTNATGGFTFSNTLGKNFTKIVMTVNGPAGWDGGNLGSGWSFSWDFMNDGSITVTWTGNASTVDLLNEASNFHGETVKSIVFYFVGDSEAPDPTYTVALKAGTVNANKVTLSATSAVEGATITVTPDEEYEITAFSAKYNTTEEAPSTLDPATGAYSFTMPAFAVTIEATIALKPVPEGDIYAGFTATAGAGGFTNEGSANLVDNKFTSGNEGVNWTKWCANDGHKSVPTGESESCWWIDFEASEALNPTGYILTTGNDTGSEHGRNPKNWVLKAKLNAGDAWTTIATVTNDVTMKNKSFKDYKFFVDQSGTYQYFRFEVFANQGANVMQLCELRLIGAEPVVVTTHTLQLHVNDALMGSLALQNPSNDIVDNGDGTYTVPEGAEVTLIATPNEGYEFTGWKASSSICDFNECEFVALSTVNNPLTVDMYMTAAFMAEFAAVAPQPQPEGDGKLTGAFTINADGDQIVFSKGNLQYQASTTTWQFATNQYDMIGADNANISDTYTGWIDLFGWGTGNNPAEKSTDDEDYSTFTDWGVNAISNGGNEANLWRTLTRYEWAYLIQTRTNAADLKGQATVADVHGFVLLPDSWTLPAGLSFTASPNDWTTNVYTAEQWAQMEAAGAVFLPAAGYRNPDIIYVGEKGWYWSSDVLTANAAYDFEFTETNSRVFGSRHYFGQPVRLVSEASPTPASTAVEIGDPNNASEVETFLETYDGQTIDELIIDRPVLNNMYNTLCLPFDMNAAQIAASSLNGVEIREFTGASVEGTTLNLSVGDPVNAVVAGRPYFVKFSAASQLDDLHFEDVTINNALLDNMAVTFDGVTFKGTFTPFVMPNGLNFQGGYLFLGQNNQLFWPNTSNPLKPFRAYFYVDVESSTPGNAPKYRGMPARIVEGKNVTTGVENAQSANQSTKVIVNGQLIIIKNDVRYNAQGQIVK